MNKVLIGVNALLVIAVAYLFYKTSGSSVGTVEGSNNNEEKTEIAKPVEKKEVPITGKIAFVNLDSLNERSLYVDYMTKKLRSSQASIEGSLENLSMQYQKKMEEYQTSASAGIAPESELAAKAREIQKIETDAKNKQMQMDNLMMEMNDKKMEFQEEVRAYIKENYASKYDYVFTYSETVPIMLYGSPSAEITNEVIYAINEKFKAKQASNKK